jgi:peroxiredoxin
MPHRHRSTRRPAPAARALIHLFFIAALLSSSAASLYPSEARAQEAVPESLPPGWQELGLKDYGKAPEIALGLHDGSGELKLSELVAQGPVLVDFWATWCSPCRMAMPQYAKLYETYRERGFSVLAVSQDSPQAVGKVRDFVAKMELPFPVVLDLEKTSARDYYIRTLPTAFLVDRRGHVVGVEIGYRPGREKHMAKQIEALLDVELPKKVEG